MRQRVIEESNDKHDGKLTVILGCIKQLTRFYYDAINPRHTRTHYDWCRKHNGLAQDCIKSIASTGVIAVLIVVIKPVIWYTDLLKYHDKSNVSWRLELNTQVSARCQRVPSYSWLLIKAEVRTRLEAETSRAPSQYKDRLIYVWRFPC